MTTNATIRLVTELCDTMVNDIGRADWDAAERGDMGTKSEWEADGERFNDAQESAVSAINERYGTIDGNELAEALEAMSSAELRWGDDPQTRRARIAIARLLDWQTDDLPEFPGARPLVEMLRKGEE
jgi:hypothetical protein